MSTEISYFMPPLRPLEEILEENAWKRFYQSILDKGSALNYVINFVDEIIKGKEQKLFDSKFDKYNEYITKYQLHSHYYKLLCQQEDKSDRNIWNIQNNILKVLKRMKTEEPLHLLPQEDRLLTNKFVGMLNQPPEHYSKCYNRTFK